jgi:hypothetical protein
MFCNVGKQAEYIEQKLIKKVLGFEAAYRNLLRNLTGSDVVIPRD